MRYILMLLLSLLLIPNAQAYDIENAKRINQSCALCHGLYGQGTPGALSPRLAGLAADYLAKEMKYYRDGTREYAPMVLASAITQMTDKDIEDISEYLAAIDLEAMDLPEIPLYAGDVDKGKEIYLDECKFCHKKTGRGKPKKGIPMVTGQYGLYLHNQLRKFKNRERHHDDDPDDDLFDEYDDKTLASMVAFLTALTDEQAQQRKLAAIKERIAAKDKEGSGMISMAQMTGMAAMNGMMGDVCKDCTGEDGFAGRFTITPSGEIILSPKYKDLRKLAGTTGRFKADKNGALEFVPDAKN